MFGLQLNTFDRDAAEKNEAARPFIGSYLWMRMAIGLLGVSLPVLLVLVDWWFVHARRPIRGSMSAYYHSSAQDLFVGGLVSTGLFLITYMSAKKRTYDYVLSTTGGLLVIVVAFLPTARSGAELGVKHFEPNGTSCTDHPGPPLCNGFENEWGEGVVRTIHQTCASAFVVLLILLCLVFALREFGYGPEAKALVGSDLGVKEVRAELKKRHVGVLTYLWKGLPEGTTNEHDSQLRAPRRRVLTYLAAGVVILASALWGLFGVSISLFFVDGQIGPTYVAEFGAFVTFGIAWLTAAWDLMPGPLRTASEKVAGAVDSISGTAPATPS
jgi:hypothetical protein